MADDITALLRAARAGDARASDDLARVLAGELRAIAAGILRKEPGEQTLQPTALVNEAWLRFGDGGAGARDYADRVHFFATAAKIMRQVLVDKARARLADKRGGEWTRVTLNDAQAPDAFDADVLSLHDALEKLHSLSPRQAQVVELRWFGGLTQAECATELGVSATTIENDWAFARAWLRRELGRS